MLRNVDLTVSEIAYQLGFSSHSYFTTCYRNFFGYPPGEVKNLDTADQGQEGMEAAQEDAGPGLKSGRQAFVRAVVKPRNIRIAIFSALGLSILVLFFLFIPKLLQSSVTVPQTISSRLSSLSFLQEPPIFSVAIYYFG